MHDSKGDLTDKLVSLFKAKEARATYFVSLV